MRPTRSGAGAGMRSPVDLSPPPHPSPVEGEGVRLLEPQSAQRSARRSLGRCAQRPSSLTSAVSVVSQPSAPSPLAREGWGGSCAGSPGFFLARRLMRKQLKPNPPTPDIGGKQDTRSFAGDGHVWPRRGDTDMASRSLFGPAGFGIGTRSSGIGPTRRREPLFEVGVDGRNPHRDRVRVPSPPRAFESKRFRGQCPFSHFKV